MDLISKIKNILKNNKIIGLIILSVLCIGIIIPSQALAIPTFSEVLFILIGALLRVQLVIATLLLYLGGAILDMVIGSALNVQSLDSVDRGWSIARDTVNMFFVIFLLIIAFATILRIEAYQYKALLPKLIFSILLVNFSRTICNVLIEFSNVLTATFLGFSTQGSAGANSAAAIAAMMGVDDIFSTESGIEALRITNPTMLAAFFLIVVLVAILAMAFIGLAGMMLMRTVVLLVLIVISPLAFVMNVLPVTKSYFTEWWQSFIKFCFYGPIAAFCLFLTANVVADASGDSTSNTGLGANLTDFDPSVSQNILPTVLGNPSFIWKYGLAVGLLFLGISMIRQGGGMLANMSLDLAKKGFTGGAALAGKGLKLGAKKVRQTALKSGTGLLGRNLNQGKYGKMLTGAVRAGATATFLPQAWKARSARLDAEIEAPAAASAEDALDKYVGLGEKHRHRDRVDRAMVKKKMSEQDAKSSPEQLRAFKESMNENLKPGMEAALLAAVQNNNMNDLLSDEEIFNKFKQKMIEIDPKVVDEDTEAHFSPEIAKNFIRAAFGDEAGKRIAANIQEIAGGAGNFGMFGMVVGDEKGELEWTDTETQNNVVWDKQAKIEPQAYWRQGHINAFKEETEGDIGDFHAQGWVQLENLDKGRIDNMKRMRGDIVAGLKKNGGVEKMLKRANDMMQQSVLDGLKKTAEDLQGQVDSAIASGDKKGARRLSIKQGIAQQKSDSQVERANLLKTFANKLNEGVEGGS